MATNESDATSERSWDDPDHARSYLADRVELPHRREGEAVLVECIPPTTRRVLDLGSGDGRILAAVLSANPEAAGVALDHNPTMLQAAAERFGHHGAVDVVDHDLDQPLPDSLGTFDVVVSGLAIHHVAPDRRRALYREIAGRLEPGGAFADLDFVRSATEVLHDRFIEEAPWDRNPDRAWDRHPSVAERMRWMTEAGLDNVDCVWRWRELTLIVGERAAT
ncbi:MAG: class I SAM-dependent methyltransferase [Acidimicrobiales bacterium]